MTIIKKIQNTLMSKELPKWFRIFNLIIIAPIIVWVIIVYGSIFLLDNPKNPNETLGLVLLIDSYPIYLLVLAYLNIKIFNYSKILGLIIPTSFLILILGLLTYIAIYITKDIQDRVQENRIAEERKDNGFIGDADTYKIIDSKLYYRDTLIGEVDKNSIIYLDSNFVKDSRNVYYKGQKFKDADAETFYILFWDWQRDKKHYYKSRKIVPNIDIETFDVLNYYYAKDKFNVFYLTEIIKGADINTFTIIEGTEYAKDNNHCYRLGKIVDCKTCIKK